MDRTRVPDDAIRRFELVSVAGVPSHFGLGSQSC